jgi:glyoxylase-like metal-dependent hydrolase (beta-lactamase superfamily II)
MDTTLGFTEHHQTRRDNLSEIHPKIEKFHVNMRDDIYVEAYLLRGARNIIIDTGIVPAPDRDIAPALRTVGLDLSDIDLIINTHGHPDHIGGNARMKEASGAEIWIHREDAPFLDDRERVFELYNAPVLKAMARDAQTEKQVSMAMSGPVISPDRLIEDGTTIDCGVGLKLETIHLPGHSPGSVGFFWEKEGILFSGDSIPGLHTGGGVLPIIMDLEKYRASLRHVQELHPDMLLSGHPYRGITLAPASVRQGKEVDQFLKESLEFAERLDESIAVISPSRNEKSFMDLCDEVIGQLPKEMAFSSMAQTGAFFLTVQAIFFRLYPLQR